MNGRPDGGARRRRGETEETIASFDEDKRHLITPIETKSAGRCRVICDAGVLLTVSLCMFQTKSHFITLQSIYIGAISNIKVLIQ